MIVIILSKLLIRLSVSDTIKNKSREEAAMSKVQVISVNPGVKTIGELSRYNRLARLSRAIAPTTAKHHSLFKRTVNLLFGLNKGVDTRLSGKLMLLRLLCGSLMVSSVAIPMISAEIFSFQMGIESMVMLTLGVSLMLGFLSRLTSYAGVAWFGYNLALSLIAGVPEVSYGALMLLMLVFSVLGPGLFSADQLLRKALFAMRRSMRQRKRKDATVLDYRAFAQVERRIS